MLSTNRVNVELETNAIAHPKTNVTLILPVAVVMFGALVELSVLDPEHQKYRLLSKGMPSVNVNVRLLILGQGTLTRISSEPTVPDVPLAQRIQLTLEPSMLSTMIDFKTHGPPETFLLIVATQSSECTTRCLNERSNSEANSVIHYFLEIAAMAFSAESPAMYANAR